MAAPPRAIARKEPSIVQHRCFGVNAIRREGHSMEHLDGLRNMRKLPTRSHDLLTTRERQIIRVLSDGVTNKEIGRRLRLAEGTVKVHLHHIYRKLGIANRTALAVLAHTNTF
jgi:DNA-binding NarL/FixJ family response regulator